MMNTERPADVFTDDEVKLYYQFYKRNGIKRDIDKYLKMYEDSDCPTDKEELLDLLRDIKEIL